MSWATRHDVGMLGKAHVRLGTLRARPLHPHSRRHCLNHRHLHPKGPWRRGLEEAVIDYRAEYGRHARPLWDPWRLCCRREVGGRVDGENKRMRLLVKDSRNRPLRDPM